MTDSTTHRDAVGIVRIFNTPFIEVSRVWMCAVCGAKVFYCKTAQRPEYQCCLCGSAKWRQAVRDSSK